MNGFVLDPPCLARAMLRRGQPGTASGQPFQRGAGNRSLITWRACVVRSTRQEAARMLLSSVFDAFLAKRPLCVMARGVLEHLLEPGHIDQLFVNTAHRGYQKTLFFSTLVDLFSDVV